MGIDLATYSLENIRNDHGGAAHDIIDKLAGNKVLPLFKAYIKHGYYPFYFENRDEAVFVQLLNQNLHTTIESDLIAVHPALTGNSIKKITSLLKIISASVPFISDLKKLAAMTDVGDQRTLKTYMKYLEDSGLIIGLSRTGRGLQSLEKPEKIFLKSGILKTAFWLWTTSKRDLEKKSPCGCLGFYIDPLNQHRLRAKPEPPLTLEPTSSMLKTKLRIP
ncbi:MAG: ATP-binding protein [Desulfobacterales bacterium]|nr:ATP-binding protein [Desulfobacterales bacterium]